MSRQRTVTQIDAKAKAREMLPQVGGCNPGTTDEDLRKALLKFIADFANWDNAAKRTYLEVSRALVKAAHGEWLARTALRALYSHTRLQKDGRLYFRG